MEFQSKVEEVYVTEGKDRAALGEQVKHLLSLNKRLSEDAHNLTNALKGSSKTQGNWGELLLERILESSGLRKRQDYDVQESHTRDDGSRLQPDVVVHLPEDRHLVIDAKVSLVVHEEYVAADDDLARDVAIKRHVESVRGHIKGLSAKSYQPSQPEVARLRADVHAHRAGLHARHRERQRAQAGGLEPERAPRRPSALLFVLRRCASVAAGAAKSRNAQEIARRGASSTTSSRASSKTSTKVDTSLEQARRAYDSAYGKLKSGKGNVIRQAEMLRDLGVKPTKSLPTKLIDAATDEPAALPATGTPPVEP